MSPELIILETSTLDDHQDNLDVLGDYVLSQAEELTLLSQAIRDKPYDADRLRTRGEWYAAHLHWSEAFHKQKGLFTQLFRFSRYEELLDRLQPQLNRSS